MSWSTPFTAVVGAVIKASDANQTRDNLNETAPAKATVAGQLFRATGAGAIAVIAPPTSGQVLGEAAGLPAWVAGGQNVAARVGNPSAGQSIVTGTDVAMTWDAESFDSASMHSTVTNTSRLIAPVAGVYVVWANYSFTDINAGKRLIVRLLVNGATYIARKEHFNPSASASYATDTIDAVWKFAANDYVEVILNHDNGSTMSTSRGSGYPGFAMTWLATG